MPRSNAYWAGNRYADPAQEPEPAAPLQDLPAPIAERFRLLRDGLRHLPGVGESVRFMGQSWRWAWEYGVGNRKLCWVHIVGDAVSSTFTLSDAEADRVRRLGRLSADLSRSITEAQRTGPVLADAGRPAGHRVVPPLCPAQGGMAGGAARATSRAAGARPQAG